MGSGQTWQSRAVSLMTPCSLSPLDCAHLSQGGKWPSLETVSPRHSQPCPKAEEGFSDKSRNRLPVGSQLCCPQALVPRH